MVLAYKEEETIEDALNYLVNRIKYPNLEILVGIDTLEDRTFEIVKRFTKKHKEIKVDFSPERRGFSVALDSLIKKATGEILIKNDADIRIGNPERALYDLMKIYEDEKVGGATFRMVDSLESEKNKSLISRGEIFIQRLVYDWFTERHPVIQGDWDLFLICNSFRKSLIHGLNQKVIADDVEFGYAILKKGYKLVFADIPYYPIGLAKDAKSLFFQKRRTAVALLRVSRERKINFVKYYFLIFSYFLTNIYKYSFKDVVAFFYWCLVYSASLIGAYGRINQDSRKLWIKFKRNPKLNKAR
jgi:glycosyltransferase involved in cell wall biosynthesis